jgi:hypothetical protein
VFIAAMRQVNAMVATFNKLLLEGVAAPEIMQYGSTSEEERATCGVLQVPASHTQHLLQCKSSTTGGASHQHMPPRD